MLASFERKLNKVHHLTVYISNVDVLSPEKFDERIR